MSIYEELKLKLDYIRQVYRDHSISLKPEEGLYKALEEAQAFADGIATTEPPTESLYKFSIFSIHPMWALAETIQSCLDGGLEISTHLKRITTGSVNYGTPGVSSRDHSFKDFELELFVAGILRKRGVLVEFAENPSDPRGEMIVGNVWIEIKHPNSTRQIEKNVRDFNGKMYRNGTYGVFITGIEDMFNLGEKVFFDDEEEFQSWWEPKALEIDEFGIGVIKRSIGLQRILAMAQTGCQVRSVGGRTNLFRTGNSIVFDNRSGISDETYNIVIEIAQALCPLPGLPSMYSRVAHLLSP